MLVSRILGKPEPTELSTVNYSLGHSQIRDDASAFSVDPSTVEKTFDGLLFKLNRLGSFGIILLSNSLRKYDVDKSNLVNIDEFKAALADSSVDVSEDDARSMFRYLESAARPGFMDYSLLIRDLTSGIPA